MMYTDDWRKLVKFLTTINREGEGGRSFMYKNMAFESGGVPGWRQEVRCDCSTVQG